MSKIEKKNKRTIIVICIAAVLITFGVLVLTGVIFGSKDKSNLENLDKNKDFFIIGQEEHQVFSARSGTENFGIPISFAPKNTQAWAMDGQGCKYNIQAVNQYNYCINQGWNSIIEDLSTGMGRFPFTELSNGVGYDLVKINIPKGIKSCTQRFTVDVKCNMYPNETVKDYFDLKIL